MQRLQRLAFRLPATWATLNLAVITRLKEYQFLANNITNAPSVNTFFGRSYPYYTTTQPQTV